MKLFYISNIVIMNKCTTILVSANHVSYYTEEVFDEIIQRSLANIDASDYECIQSVKLPSMLRIIVNPLTL